MGFHSDLRTHLGASEGADLDDEHVRYHLYLRSLDEVGWQVVAGLLAVEPDSVMAESL